MHEIPGPVKPPFVVLVTGSRTWADRAAVYNALNNLVSFYGEPMVVRHGACKYGADRFADEWARAMRAGGSEVSPDPHPANWGRDDNAGKARNLRMVAGGADVCLVFVGPCGSPRCQRGSRHASHGALHCAFHAIRAGIRVVVFGDAALTAPFARFAHADGGRVEFGCVVQEKPPGYVPVGGQVKTPWG